MRLSILLTAVIFANLSSASRILFLFPTPSKSHMIIVHALSTTLAEQGHDVTVFSTFPLNKQIKNHREFTTPFSAEAKAAMNGFAKGVSMAKMLLEMPAVGVQMAFDMISTDEFQMILSEKFDMIIIGLTFNNFLLGYGDHFNCPTAMLSVQRHMVLSNALVGNPVEMNAVNHGLFPSKPLDKFIPRVTNFLMSMLDSTVLIDFFYNRPAYA
jgi:glucuronosyltransferase